MSDSVHLLSSPNFVAVFERQRATALRLRTAVIAYTDTWCNAGWAGEVPPWMLGLLRKIFRWI